MLCSPGFWSSSSACVCTMLSLESARERISNSSQPSAHTRTLLDLSNALDLVRNNDEFYIYYVTVYTSH